MGGFSPEICTSLKKLTNERVCSYGRGFMSFFKQVSPLWALIRLRRPSLDSKPNMRKSGRGSPCVISTEITYRHTYRNPGREFWRKRWALFSQQASGSCYQCECEAVGRWAEVKMHRGNLHVATADRNTYAHRKDQAVWVQQISLLVFIFAVINMQTVHWCLT